MPRPLPRSFYARPTLTVARELLGAVVARRFPDGEVARGRIVETEAYVGEEDKACHARAGRTPRTDVLYARPGTAYVYLTYGMHHLLNAVTEREGFPAAVLIRAAEPLEGLPRMARARGTDRTHLLMSGPAKLCQSLGLDLRHNREDLRGDLVWIEAGEPVPDRLVATSPRIGCQTAKPPWDLIPWRMFLEGNPFVTPGRAPGAQTRGGKAPRHRE